MRALLGDKLQAFPHVRYWVALDGVKLEDRIALRDAMLNKHRLPIGILHAVDDDDCNFVRIRYRRMRRRVFLRLRPAIGDVAGHAGVASRRCPDGQG